MGQLWDLIIFFLTNDHSASKSSLRATQIIISFTIFLVLCAGYSLVVSVVSPHNDSGTGFLSTWLFVQSLVVLNHIISACAEKCEIFARTKLSEKRHLHRLPTLVRFGGAIFFMAGLTAEVGHTIVHVFLHSSTHESIFDHEDVVPQSTGLSESASSMKSEEAFLRFSLRERTKNITEEGNVLSFSPLHFIEQSRSLQSHACFPVLFGILYMILLLIFRSWILQMDAVVGYAESDLRITLPLASQLDERKTFLKAYLTKADCHLHFFVFFVNCIRNSFFSIYYRLFLFPCTMVLLCVATTVSNQTFFLSAVPLVIAILCLLARSVYVTIPMLRYLMNQNIGAEFPEFTSEMKKILEEVISSIPGEIEVSRYAWWRVSKYEEHKFFLQLKISKRDPGVISAMARRSIKNILKADVYVECEQEGDVEKVEKSPVRFVSEMEKEKDGKHPPLDEGVVKICKKCNYTQNIPFHQPHYDSSLTATLSSTEHSHLCHGHSHGCYH